MATQKILTSCSASRSQWPVGLCLGSADARLLGLCIRILPGAWIPDPCECCVLAGRGLNYVCETNEMRYLEIFIISITLHTRVGTLIVATIYLQPIQNRYMFRSFTVLHCNHQHCVQPVASDVEVVGYL